MSKSNIYYFKLHKINEDGSMEVHVDPSSWTKVDFTEARHLTPNLSDLPGGTCIWHGYVAADTPNEARETVMREY